MFETLRGALAGLVTLATIAACQPVQARATIDPVYYAGVVGDPLLTEMLTTQGVGYTFSSPLPSLTSVEASAVWNSNQFQCIRSFPDADNNITTFQIRRGGPAYTAPFFLVSTFEYRDGTTVVGTGDIYAIVFSTAEHRDAFLYYTSEKETAATEADYQYFDTLASYEFWMGQGEEAAARYVYYTGFAEYYRDTASTPQEGMYYYNYLFGIATYLYFESVGDFESAAVCWFYYYGLAVDALEGAEEPAPLKL